MHRQADGENASVGHVGGHLDVPLVHLYVFRHEIQADAAASLRTFLLFGLVEALEYLLLLCCVDAASRVAELHHEVAVYNIDFNLYGPLFSVNLKALESMFITIFRTLS